MAFLHQMQHGLAMVVVLTVAGCATAPQGTVYIPPSGDPVADGIAYIERGPRKDKVLWEYRTGLNALRVGDWDTARRVFDDAILSLGGILHDNSDARRARQLFSSEANKPFAGEPYERIMAYYYRGLIYWRDGEPDNARACFRSGLLLDSDTDEEGYAADFALLEFLDAWVTAKLSGSGQDALERARQSWQGRPGNYAACFEPKVFDPQANLLFFMECGQAPRKVASGQYGEQLRFQDGGGNARAFRVTVDGGSPLTSPAAANLFYQADTRGKRSMDSILAGQAQFKQASDQIGDAAVVSGLVLANNKDTRNAGLGIAAFGILSKLASAGANPRADTRTWDNLPGYLGFHAARLTPGLHQVLVEFLDVGGRPISGKSRSFQIEVPPNSRQEIIIFVSEQSPKPS